MALVTKWSLLFHYLAANKQKEAQFVSFDPLVYHPYTNKGSDYAALAITEYQTMANWLVPDEVPYWEKIFGKHNWNVGKGAEVGKANGLSILLDAETFDYTFHLKAGEGKPG